MAVEGEDDNRTHLTIEHVELDRLKPDPFNPRRIAEQELDALTRSIQEFGFVDPIIARREDRAVIGGHQRLLAARRLGLASVPVIFVDLSPEQAKLLNLALNRISGDWDQELLARLLAELNETPDVDITLSGFGEDEIAKLLKSLDSRERRERPETFDFDAAWEEAAADPGVRRGDIWLLGDHRLMCGDSADRGDVTRLVAGETATLLVTDPPYGVAYEPEGRKRRRPIANDDLGRGQARFWTTGVFRLAAGGRRLRVQPVGASYFYPLRVHRGRRHRAPPVVDLGEGQAGAGAFPLPLPPRAHLLRLEGQEQLAGLPQGGLGVARRPAPVLPPTSHDEAGLPLRAGDGER